MKRFELISYDVWGNKKDGYEVNDAHTTSIVICIDDNDNSDKSVIKQLKRAGFIKKNCRFESFRIDGEDDYSLYIVYVPDEYPVCELRRIKDGE